MKLELSTPVANWDLLVVDADLGVADLVKSHAPASVGRLRIATSVDQAELEMQSRPADVLLVNLQINDNAGLSLIRALRAKYPKTELIALSRARRSDLCLEAWRAGAADMLLAPIGVADLQRSLDALAQRRTHVEKLTRRNVRLRQVCKQLNKARHEISQQVDLLCNDLVKAYQEMAQQLNVTQLLAEFTQTLDTELEVEGLLRKTMEWLLKKVGPINAAVYLPDVEHHFSLGAYLNLDTEADALLISDIAETIVHKSDTPAHSLALESDAAIDSLFGHAGHRLKGRAWLSTPCFANHECLGVIVIFRHQDTHLDPSVRPMIEAIAPVLAEHIDNALSLYHRMNPHDDDAN